MFFDGTLDPTGGAIRPDPDAPGHGLTLRDNDADRTASADLRRHPRQRRATRNTATVPAAAPAANAPSRPWCCEAHSWKLRAVNRSSKRPWVPKSLSRSTGSQRLAGWSGICSPI